ncbi:MAG: ABC transporter permease [Campylobacterota bacterium]
MFKAIVKKEFLLIFRDIHALLVLFVMPVLFIIIMSLALQDSFEGTMTQKYTVALVGSEQSGAHKRLQKHMKNNTVYTVVAEPAKDDALLYQKGYDFIVLLPDNFLQKIQNDPAAFSMEIVTRPGMKVAQIKALEAVVSSSILKVMLNDVLHSLGVQQTDHNLRDKVTYTFVNRQGQQQQRPTSAQHSVPAWLVFSMFFILIPISNTFIAEKKEQTLKRIRSTGVSLLPVMIGKFVPYFVINQIQVVIMLLVGFFLLPLLGAQALVVEGSMAGVFMISAAVSLGAISFGLLIANIAKTTEEATTLGGVSNIILAALGGVMVPSFVMPEVMRELSQLSPMSWALEGFLEFILQAGSLSAVADNILYLILFGIINFIIAFYLLQKRSMSGG